MAQRGEGNSSTFSSYYWHIPNQNRLSLICSFAVLHVSRPWQIGLKVTVMLFGIVLRTWVLLSTGNTLLTRLVFSHYLYQIKSANLLASKLGEVISKIPVFYWPSRLASQYLGIPIWCHRTSKQKPPKLNLLFTLNILMLFNWIISETTIYFFLIEIFKRRPETY